jgi:hypothetical protein
MSRKLRPLAALAIVALIGAGCSNGSAENGNTDTTSSSRNKNTTTRDKAARFSECMRDNGVSEFPDPDASGQLTIDAVVNRSSLDTSSPAWKTAIAACRDLQPSGFMGHKRSDEQQSAALEFAQCIRENGVEDFPDPAKGEPLVNTNNIPSANRPGGMDILNAAMHTCRDGAAKAIGNQP